MTSRIDFEQVATDCLARAKSLIPSLLPGGRWEGDEWVCGSYQGGKGDSCKVNARNGKSSDFATGESAGDLIGLVAIVHNCSQLEAAHWLTGNIEKMDNNYEPAPKKQRVTKERKWSPIIPAQAPVPKKIVHWMFSSEKHEWKYTSTDGTPDMMWVYRTVDGDPIQIICRYNKPDGGKDIYPFTFGNMDGKIGWRWKQIPENRPMYGLETIGDETTICITEGEKACDAMRKLVANPAVTWPGGGKAIKKVDWSPLEGKSVILFADGDDAGRKSMQELAAILHPICKAVRICETPDMEGIKGWDAADALTDGWTNDQFMEFCQKYIAKYEPSAIDTKSIPFSEDAIAQMFISRHGHNIKYIAAQGAWYHWDGKIWEKDGTLFVIDLVKNTCRENGALYFQQHHKEGGAKSLQSNKTVSAVEKLSRSDRLVSATNDIWDSDNLLLNTPDNVIDLRDGSSRNHSKRDYMTKSTIVTPSGSCDLWLKTLNEITGGNVDLINYLQRLAGYCLTGSTKEHAFIFIYGPGGNGKGIFLNTLFAILGSYAANASMSTFMDTGTDRHPTDLAMLCGARLVIAQETEEGKCWAESRIKSITGGDPVTARFMRQDFFTYTPQYKIIIAGNHKPRLRNPDAAMRRRLHLIPFTQQFTEKAQDKQLSEKLKVEYPGILQWAIEGAKNWREIGLSPPKIIHDTTNEYFAEEDTIQQWIDTETVLAPDAQDESSLLYTSYKDWCRIHEEDATSQKTFIQTLKSKYQELKSDRCKSSRRKTLVGIRRKITY